MIAAKGLYMKEPHGELVWKGKKRAIARAHPIDIAGQTFVLVSGGKAYGDIEIGEPEIVGPEQFDQRFDEHRVSTKERHRWWRDATSLYLYPITSFTPLETPRPVAVPPGVHAIMDEVHYLADGKELLPDQITVVTEPAPLPAAQHPAFARRVNPKRAEKGGPGSGFFGHAGRPGKRGGSAPGRGHGANPVANLGGTVNRRIVRAEGWDKLSEEAVTTKEPITIIVNPANRDTIVGIQVENHEWLTQKLGVPFDQYIRLRRDTPNAPISIRSHMIPHIYQGSHGLAFNAGASDMDEAAEPYVIRTAGILRDKGFPGDTAFQWSRAGWDRKHITYTLDEWLGTKSLPDSALQDIPNIPQISPEYPKSFGIRTHTKGGPGSGNFGHAGRRGQVGGSARRAVYSAVDEAELWRRPPADWLPLNGSKYHLKKRVGDRKVYIEDRHPDRHVADASRGRYRISGFDDNAMGEIQDAYRDRLEDAFADGENYLRGIDLPVIQQVDISSLYSTSPTATLDKLPKRRRPVYYAGNRKGGPGSGNFGHAGRPGKRGGSAPSSGHRMPYTVLERGEDLDGNPFVVEAYEAGKAEPLPPQVKEAVQSMSRAHERQQRGREAMEDYAKSAAELDEDGELMVMRDPEGSVLALASIRRGDGSTHVQHLASRRGGSQHGQRLLMNIIQHEQRMHYNEVSLEAAPGAERVYEAMGMKLSRRGRDPWGRWGTNWYKATLKWQPPEWLTQRRKPKPERKPKPTPQETGQLSMFEAFKGVKGGVGSGNFGHAGRLGKRGGSAPRRGHGLMYDIASPARDADDLRQRAKWPEMGAEVADPIERRKRIEGALREVSNELSLDAVFTPDEYQKKNGVTTLKRAPAGAYWITPDGAILAPKNPGVAPLHRYSAMYALRAVGKDWGSDADCVAEGFVRWHSDSREQAFAVPPRMTSAQRDMVEDVIYRQPGVMFTLGVERLSWQRINMDGMLEAIDRYSKGGPGSGHFGHAGRPGKRGGSAPSNRRGHGALNAGLYAANYAVPAATSLAGLAIGGPVGYVAGGAAGSLVMAGVNVVARERAMQRIRERNRRRGRIANPTTYQQASPMLPHQQAFSWVRRNGPRVAARTATSFAGRMAGSLLLGPVGGYVGAQAGGIAGGVTADAISRALSNRQGRKGGPGSGFHGHAGRPGKRGGSAPQAGHASASTMADFFSTRDGGVLPDEVTQRVGPISLMVHRSRYEVAAALPKRRSSGFVVHDELDMHDVLGDRFDNYYRLRRYQKGPLEFSNTLLDSVESFHLFGPHDSPLRQREERAEIYNRRYHVADALTKAGFPGSTKILFAGKDTAGYATDRRGFAVVSLDEIAGRDVKGGVGSGNFGHAGRPGKRGGSSPGKGHAGQDRIGTWNDRNEWEGHYRAEDPLNYQVDRALWQKPPKEWMRMNGVLTRDDRNPANERESRMGTIVRQHPNFGGGAARLTADVPLGKRYYLLLQADDDTRVLPEDTLRRALAVADLWFSRPWPRGGGDDDGGGGGRDDDHGPDDTPPGGRELVPQYVPDRVVTADSRRAERETGTGFVPHIPRRWRAKGGAGSGNFGHAGRPGKRGGSAPGRGHSMAKANGIKTKVGTMYHASSGQTLPNFILDGTRDGVSLVVSRDGVLAVGKNVNHMKMVFAYTSDADERKRLMNGAHFRRLGSGPIQAYTSFVVSMDEVDRLRRETDNDGVAVIRALDILANKIVRQSASTLMRVGFAPDTPVEWKRLDGKTITGTLADFDATNIAARFGSKGDRGVDPSR